MSGKSEIPVCCSSVNWLDRHLSDSLALPIAPIIASVKRAGYDGLEWHPNRTVAGLQMVCGLLSPDEKKMITSGHQTWRSEMTLGEVWHHPYPALALISYILLPERIASLDHLENIQGVVGKQLPMVLYPTHAEKEESGTGRNFGEKLFQPNADVMKRWGVQTLQELIDAAFSRGYTGLCLDLFHMRLDSSSLLANWKESFKILLPYTKEVHLGLGRTDFERYGNFPVNSMEELHDMVFGREKTEIKPMIRTLKDLGWNGPMVTEIPAEAFFRIAPRRQITFTDFIAQHRPIVDTVKEIFED